MSSADPPPLSVVLCSGSDCATDERKAYVALSRRLEAADVSATCSPCLGVCHGPVVVVSDDRHRAVVIEKLRSKSRHKRLIAAVASGRLSKVASAAPEVHKPKRRTRALRRAGRLLNRELV
ncbi:MAG: hypothetical protein AAF480_07415 [Actinomycetota bacterium]